MPVIVVDAHDERDRIPLGTKVREARERTIEAGVAWQAQRRDEPLAPGDGARAALCAASDDAAMSGESGQRVGQGSAVEGAWDPGPQREQVEQQREVDEPVHARPPMAAFTTSAMRRALLRASCPKSR